MDKQTRRFYARFHLFTFAIPAYLTAMLVYWLGLLAYHPRSEQLSGAVEIIAGVAVFAACPGAYEITCRLGFMLINLPGAVVAPSPDDEAKLAIVVAAPAGQPQDLLPKLVDLGTVPLLMVGDGSPAPLWLSTYTLRRFSIKTLTHLVAHERAHLSRGSLAIRLLVHGVYWWVVMFVAVRLVQQPLVALAVVMIAASLFLRLVYWIRSNDERKADQKAAGAAAKHDYARALAEYLWIYRRNGRPRLIRDRLRNLGLGNKEIDAITAELDETTG